MPVSFVCFLFDDLPRWWRRRWFKLAS